jgi:hypothetical protein
MSAPVAGACIEQAGAAQGEHAGQDHPVTEQPRAAKALTEQQEREQRDEHRHHARQHDADMGGRREGHAQRADQEKRCTRAAHHDCAFEPAGLPIGGHAAQQERQHDQRRDRVAQQSQRDRRHVGGDAVPGEHDPAAPDQDGGQGRQ